MFTFAMRHGISLEMKDAHLIFLFFIHLFEEIQYYVIFWNPSLFFPPKTSNYSEIHFTNF